MRRSAWILLGLLPVLTAQGALDIAQTPLYLGTRAEPNIMFTLDDSGSMDFTYLSTSNQEPSGWRYYSATPHR